MGYIGPVVAWTLRAKYPDYIIDGFDNAYFAHSLTSRSGLPERHLDSQFFGDVRSMKPQQLEGYDAVVELAAVSNDPMGDRYAGGDRRDQSGGDHGCGRHGQPRPG
ncbi:hypothetical protein N8D56_14920 [Devosia sp. A8/3-2]|nr:hypothetical protein N8D56_14920 [Devosia sp. A8/3-2]